MQYPERWQSFHPRGVAPRRPPAGVRTALRHREAGAGRRQRAHDDDGEPHGARAAAASAYPPGTGGAAGAGGVGRGESMSGHAPGPWTIEDDDFGSDDEDTNPFL